MNPELLKLLMAAFSGGAAQQHPFGLSQSAPQARTSHLTAALSGPAQQPFGLSPAAPPQGQGLAPQDEPLGENAHLGWGTAPPMDYGPPQGSPSHSRLGGVVPGLRGMDNGQDPQRRGAGDFNHPRQFPIAGVQRHHLDIDAILRMFQKAHLETPYGV